MSNTSNPSSATPLLDAIKKPGDLKDIPRTELDQLAAEIRNEIIRVVTRTGGHLASSLGAVELIIALHYILDCPYDKIVFDVGHQAYAHKILTGRRELFEKLRLEEGLSGFPKRSEGPYDPFDTGHSSTSVSAALGLACARDLAGDQNTVVAVLGDGALTGGMALEAMNHAGALKKKLIVVLNDNNMSIGPNVGGLSEYLSLLVTKPAYVRFRRKIKGGLTQYLPRRGHSVVAFLRRIEDAVKSIFTSPSTLFETMGFRYLGPFDGHDVNTLIDGLSGAKNLDRPVLMHVVTTKGKGYLPAEEDPCTFHGVSCKSKDSEPHPGLAAPPKNESYSAAFGKLLSEEAAKNKKVVAISAAMSEGTGLNNFFQLYPERAFDVGIAEQHALTLAAGLAADGLRPVVAIYSSFLQRAFDQLFHDIALQNLPVLIAVDRAGLVGEDGPTHHGGLDLSYLRLLPNFTVMAPADAEELMMMLSLGLTLPGPSAIRYPRGSTPAALSGNPAPVIPGRGVLMSGGSDVCIVAIGATVAPALTAAQMLAEQGCSASVINMRFIKPLDTDLLVAEGTRSGRLLTVEENLMTGGLYGAVCEAVIAHQAGGGGRIIVRGLGLTDSPVNQAPQNRQRMSLGLDAEGIAAAALRLAEEP